MCGRQAPGARRSRPSDPINITDVLKQLASGVLPPGTATVQPGDGASTQPEVCGNGTCLGYATDATNLTPEAPDTNGVPDVVRQPVVTPPPRGAAARRAPQHGRGGQRGDGAQHAHRAE